MVVYSQHRVDDARMEWMLENLSVMAVRHAQGRETLTALPRLTVWSSVAPTEPTQAMFEPKFYILLQGAKRLTIGSETFDFSAGTYSVSAIGLPFTGQVTEASVLAPYLGVELALDARIVASLLLDMPDQGEQHLPAFAVVQATKDIAEPLDRLLRLLDKPADIPILAAQIERELVYRVLQGPMGHTVRQMVQHNTRFQQIRTAVDWICRHACEPMCVQRLAASVGMSVTSFHRHFKAVTAHSPLAYQRHIRLLEARRLVASRAANVTMTAFATGYANSSQFSREYKRMFGVSPIHDATLASDVA